MPARRYAVRLLAVTLLLLLGAVALPNSRYVRYQQLEDGDHLKLRWIYERLNFDPTPIDVALIGTSRMLNGADSILVERAMRAAGDVQVHVANLAVPTPGDDLHALIVHMLLRTHRPRVLVIEANEVEGRAAHPEFARLADAAEILTAPKASPDALYAIASLPGRQISLFAESVRAWLDGTASFDPSRYSGPHWNDTLHVTFHGHRQGPERLSSPPRAAFDAESAHVNRLEHARAAQFQAPHGGLLFGYNNHYLRDLLLAARAAGVRVIVLYLPQFGGPSAPAEADLYRQVGELWTPPAELLGNTALWNDPEHLNFHGAEQLSAWLAARLSEGPTQSAAVPPQGSSGSR